MTDPWELAHAAAERASVALRALVSVEECDASLRVMAATWGEHSLVPREMVRALGESGNEPWGAFEGSELVGFVLGWAGVDEGGLHVHSHMLAVVPGRRHGGVGFALKVAQRAQALEKGIGVVRWTFDPLVARNAYFNLHKLGAVVDRFGRDFYGEMTDVLNRGDRSDRGVIRWDLAPEPGPRTGASSEGPVAVRRHGDRPEVLGSVVLGGAVVEVPEDFAALRERDPEAARAWRDVVAQAFDEAMGSGLVASAFDRGRGAYVFAPGGSPTAVATAGTP